MNLPPSRVHRLVYGAIGLAGLALVLFGGAILPSEEWFLPALLGLVVVGVAATLWAHGRATGAWRGLADRGWMRIGADPPDWSLLPDLVKEVRGRRVRLRTIDLGDDDERHRTIVRVPVDDGGRPFRARVTRHGLVDRLAGETGSDRIAPVDGTAPTVDSGGIARWQALDLRLVDLVDRDVRVGDPGFDAEFEVATDPPEHAREVFDHGVREAMLDAPGFAFLGVADGTVEIQARERVLDPDRVERLVAAAVALAERIEDVLGTDSW